MSEAMEGVTAEAEGAPGAHQGEGEPQGYGDGGAGGGETYELDIVGVPKHGGAYVLYDIFGNNFEVSSKYVPPIRPIGRGAYGIVW